MPQSDQSAAPSSQSSNAAQSSTATTSTDQTSTTSKSTAVTADQNATPGDNKLPQTATPLPLLALLGMGSLTSGLLARRKK
jgi:LPXTG-motif cell wall-anchored protein